MKIEGKVHCLFEQSGTFKNEFIKLGIPAKDYDIQNNFNQTDFVIDLFGEIERAYEQRTENREQRTENRENCTVFDSMSSGDLIFAFFPCIYFTNSSNPLEFSLITHKELPIKDRIKKIINRAKNREHFYELLLKLCYIVYCDNLKLIIENPWNSDTSYLKHNFLEEPKIIDTNRMLRGDYFVKPTAYWFINCEPTHGLTQQNDKKQKIVRSLQGAKGDGLCSEERSMISPDYARNFICDFILGKYQPEINGNTLFLPQELGYES